MNHKLTPYLLSFSKGKDTQFQHLIKAINHFHPLTNKVILRFSKHFNITPEQFVLLAELHRMEGGLSWN